MTFFLSLVCPGGLEFEFTTEDTEITEDFCFALRSPHLCSEFGSLHHPAIRVDAADRRVVPNAYMKV